MKFKALVPAAIMMAALLISGCGEPKKVEFVHEIKDIRLKLEAPVTPGPNTIQAEVQLNMDEVFKTNKADRTKIRDVSIQEMSFTMDNGGNFDNFESFVVNFFSDKDDMEKLASLNPIPKGSGTIKPVATEKAKIEKYFSEPTIYVIVDANITNPDSVSYEMTGNIKMKIAAVETK